MLSIPRLWRSRTGGALIASRVIARGTFSNDKDKVSSMNEVGYTRISRLNEMWLMWRGMAESNQMLSYLYYITIYYTYMFMIFYGYTMIYIYMIIYVYIYIYLFIYLYIVSQWNRSTNFMHLDVNLNPSTDSYTRCPVPLLSNRTRMGFVAVTNVNPCRRTKIIAQFLF